MAECAERARMTGLRWSLRERALETYWLPSDLDAFDSAAPGEYRLQSSGEVVINPEFITTWVVEAPTEYVRPLKAKLQGG